MRRLDHGLRLAALCGLALSATANVARAAVPADYKGTPYKGTPSAIPGRIELENLDLGGVNVAWKVDDSGNTASGKDYRPGDHDLPQISACNVNGFVDKLTDGTIYPSPTMQQCYYIGWLHAGDWVKVTVDVKQAGKYRLSSTFAADPAMISFDIAFNGITKGTYTLPGTSNVHVWRRFDDIGTIDLDAGLQVLQLTAKVIHLQEDYLELTLLETSDGGSDGGAVVDASSAEGGGGSGASTGGAGGAGTGGADAAGGATASDGAVSPSGAGGTTGAAGAAGLAGASGVAGSGVPSTPTGTGAGGARASSGGGCDVSGGRATSPFVGLAFCVGCALSRHRRRKST
jgi:hypothetical protein